MPHIHVGCIGMREKRGRDDGETMIFSIMTLNKPQGFLFFDNADATEFYVIGNFY